MTKFERVRTVIADLLGKKEGDVKARSRICNDLGANRKNLHEIINSLHIYFPEADLSFRNLTLWHRCMLDQVTVGMLVSYICVRQGQQERKMVKNLLKKLCEEYA